MSVGAAASPCELSRLAEMVRAVEERGKPTSRAGLEDASSLILPWAELPRGLVHEWFLDDSAPPPPDRSGGEWTPPFCILSDLAWHTVLHDTARRVFWIGRRCWPHAPVLLRDRGRDRRLLAQSVFVDTDGGVAPRGRDREEARLWAIDLVLRSPAVTAVVADGGGLDMAATRRLQLAAEAGGALALVARPMRDLKMLTAAGYRWKAVTISSRDGDAPAAAALPCGGRRPWNQFISRPRPGWRVELLRCKGRQPTASSGSGSQGPGNWLLEWDGDKGLVAVPADLADRSVAEKTGDAAGGRGRRQTA